MTWEIENKQMPATKLWIVTVNGQQIFFGEGAEGERLAHLFAAAPDMLDALKAVINSDESGIELAKTAIAEAEHHGQG